MDKALRQHCSGVPNSAAVLIGIYDNIFNESTDVVGYILGQVHSQVHSQVHNEHHKMYAPRYPRQ